MTLLSRRPTTGRPRCLTSCDRALWACALVALAFVAPSCQTREPAGGNTDESTPGVEPGNANEIKPGEPNVTSPLGEPNVAVPPSTGNGNVAQTPNAGVVPIATVNPNLRFVGRFDTSDSAGPIMSWPGSKIVAGFSGTSVTLNIRAIDQQTYYGIGNVDNYLDVSIDGGSPNVVRVPQQSSSFALAKGLAPGNHTLVVTKRTEGQIGSLQFSGLTLDAGATLVPGPAPRTRKLQFIGDSGTVGYGADGNWAATRCSFTPLTENAPVAYSMVTGDLLGADVHLIGNSGKGIYQNRDTVNDAVTTLPVLWTMTSADSFAQPNDANAAVWKQGNFVPDAVVVIVGGNDFAASTPSAANYNKVAVAFLRNLRAAYPNAWIYVAISPMLDAPVQGETRPSTSEVGIQYAKAMVTTVADPKVSYLSLALDDGSRGVGCDFHMNAATHRLTAQVIAAAIAKDLNWK